MTKAEALIIHQNCNIQAMMMILIENMCENDAEILTKGQEIQDRTEALMEETMKNYDSTF